MTRMRSHFTEEQIVELGYFVSLTYGQQHWGGTAATSATARWRCRA